jgi:hypothetical protein
MVNGFTKHNLDCWKYVQYRNTTHYLFSEYEYFQSQRAKNIKTNFISLILCKATNFQNGHRFFLGKLL